MAHDKKHHRRLYMVAWISRIRPEEKRGMLGGWYTKEGATAMARSRNLSFAHEFYWVVRPPKFKEAAEVNGH